MHAAAEITRILWNGIDCEKRTVIIRDRRRPKRKRASTARQATLASRGATTPR
ncbi:MAG: hypothetical protein JWP59_141 [Massilia sp.]|nr:hypothetical protein [Massilia sp.]